MLVIVPEAPWRGEDEEARMFATPIRLFVPLASLGMAAAAFAAPPLEVGKSYRIDPAAARAGFDLGATMHTVHGVTRKVEGEVRLLASRQDGFALEGKVAIDAASLDTQNARRDRKMREESLAVREHPSIVFVPEMLDLGKPDPASSGGRTFHELSGALTIRGVTKKVAIPVTVTTGGSRVRVDGRVTVALADYGVPDPSAFLLRVEKSAVVSFHIELLPQ
jgi:polyisoprenoid-binding protein YceI